MRSRSGRTARRWPRQALTGSCGSPTRRRENSSASSRRCRQRSDAPQSFTGSTQMIRRLVMAILLAGLVLFIVAVGVPYLDRTMLADQAVEDAILASNQEDWPRAEERYSAAIRKLPPDSAEASRVYMARGAVRVQMKRFDDAVADFSRCLAIEPNSDTYWAERGITYYKAGRYQQADADLERCLAINDVHTGACLCLGASAERQGDLDRAVLYYTRATTMPPVGPGPFAGLARVYAAKGDRAKAQENAARARAINPDVKLEIE